MPMQPSPIKRLPERTYDTLALPPGAEAARQAASAAQWLARFAGSWLPAEPGNAQLLLRLEPVRRVLVSRPAVAGLSLELNLAELSMQLLENGVPSPHRMELQDRTPAHIEAWLLVEMLHRDVDRSRFSKSLPWPIGDLMNGDSEEFTPETIVAPLAALAEAMALAQLALARLAGVETGAVQVSADNFHLSVTLPAPVEGNVMLAGLAPGDTYTPEPYFYVARTLPRPGGAARPAPLLAMSEIIGHNLSAGHIAATMRAALPKVSSKAAE